MKYNDKNEIDYNYYNASDIHSKYHELAIEDYYKQIQERKEEFINDLHNYHFEEAPKDLFNKIFYYIETNFKFNEIPEEIENFLSEFQDYFRQGI
jgi:hypothetical protein